MSTEEVSAHHIANGWVAREKQRCRIFFASFHVMGATVEGERCKRCDEAPHGQDRRYAENRRVCTMHSGTDEVSTPCIEDR